MSTLNEKRLLQISPPCYHHLSKITSVCDMGFWHALLRVFCRFRYPVSLPEEVAEALGISVPSLVSFRRFLKLLTTLDHPPARLQKYMKRGLAEALFAKAIKKEAFQTASLFSYYFKKDGWLAFRLNFDEQARLRRLYIEHSHLPHESVEIPLS